MDLTPRQPYSLVILYAIVADMSLFLLKITIACSLFKSGRVT